MANRVYVSLGRRCGKTMLQNKYIEELRKSGKEVVLVEPKCVDSKLRGATYAGAIVDLDILSPEQMERAERMLDQILKGERK